ncbi:MAG: GTP 3',8-cyclase MoaA [Treponema sp.]|nr:GTP 3',8-cyclase MoaA [Treponema sp.]
MIDQYGRTIDYMRVSITNRCNLRCVYCMPPGSPTLPAGEPLSYPEILSVCEAAAACGLRFIKITGGEPLLRAGCSAFIGELKKTAGIEKVTLTTNGVLLTKHLDALLEAGIDGVNISLDSLNRERLKGITSFDVLEPVMEAINESLKQHINLKINAVLAGADQEMVGWKELVELARDAPLSVRFIEMMPIGYGKQFMGSGNDLLLDYLRAEYPGIKGDTLRHGQGPAVYYTIPGFKGNVGFISAMSSRFCSVCNRIRLTAEGFLKPCLCYKEGIDLKPTLQTGGDLRRGIEQAIAMKPYSHCFDDLQTTGERLEQEPMIAIGG